MKFIASILVLTAIWPVSYATVIEKRDAISDVCSIGYATINGGTTGGGGIITTVTSLAALTAAVAGTAKKLIVISGVIAGNTVVNVGSNTSLVGARGSALMGVGLRVFSATNVIIRSVMLSTSKHLLRCASITSTSLAIETTIHYGSLLNITHKSTGVTVSNSKFSNHWEACLVGDSDSSGAEDSQITVTFASNYWTNLDSAISPFRFGHSHIFNNLFDSVNDGINPSDGAQLLVENNVGTSMSRAVYPTSGGFAVARNNDFGGAPITAPPGTFVNPPYLYTLIATSLVRSSIVSRVGHDILKNPCLATGARQCFSISPL